MMHRFEFAVLIVIAGPSQAQRADASLDQLAATPVVTVHISEQLRAPPDEATLTISTASREATASAALASNKLKTEQLVAAIRTSGIGAKDSQTEGVSVRAEYRYDNVNGRGQQHLIGYVARNSVRIKTRHIDEVAALLDAMTAAGATEVYGPQFSIADPAPLRAEARRRAMTRGQAEAAEYARNAGFARVR